MADRKPVLRAEHQLDTRVYINQSHSAAVLWHLLIIRQNIFHILTPHSHSVIGNHQINLLLLLKASYEDSGMVILIHISYSIMYGIFQNRLQNQSWNLHVIEFFR